MDSDPCYRCWYLLTLTSSIKRNAETSPLLKLPLEIKHKSFFDALGGRKIGVKFLDYDSSPLSGRALAHHGDVSPHSLSLLATCRQLYTEVHPIFWSTNMFSFDNPDILKAWVEGRTAFEKRAIRRIELVMVIKGDESRWSKILSARLVKHLTGLRDLRLTLSANYTYGLTIQQYTKFFKSIDYMFIADDSLDGLAKLATLPLKTVEVCMVLTTHSRRPDRHWREHAWKGDHLQKYADMVKRMMLDPDLAGTKARLLGEASGGPSENTNHQERMI